MVRVKKLRTIPIVLKLAEIEDLAIAFPIGSGQLQRVVDGVWLAVGEQEAVALVGASGSGKSLTVLALLGLLPPPGIIVRGQVRLAGTDVQAAEERVLQGLRGRVAGLVQQEPSANFNPVQRVWRGVSEAAARHHLVQGKAERQALAIRLLREVGLERPASLAQAFPHELSGGERQRAAVAAALAAEPKLLLADEPTSALDTVSQFELLQLLLRLRQERGLALLVVTHDLLLAATVAQRIVVLHAGETVEIVDSSRLRGGAAHPYTQALWAEAGLLASPPPSPRRACRFVANCPQALPRCWQARPALVARPTGEWVRCFLYSGKEELPDG